ncbi:hypothetical protein RHSIM_Rhsim01G0009100 [Rhododendron simsii]|uniref:Protein kinase domain-containing protein n=1 Tax=Rhododendron simsii TaxID=118357 RepID=A0A834LW99_RHOSS|nr:hypothetical protein RHSIM_Rhsim01G0009100 [Rhododendron simsii]
MGSSCSCCGTEKVNNGIPSGSGNVDSTGSSNPWRIFTYKELSSATNGFRADNKLGEGGFGSVYWGKTSDGLQEFGTLPLPSIYEKNSNGPKVMLAIAVKKLKSMSTKAEMEFAVEVEVLGRVRHKNLLGLRGYCADADQRLIVYDYMPNLSLASHLHGQFAHEVHLDWKRRINIALGSAEGLMYLHHEVSENCDVYSYGILLMELLTGRKPIQKLPGEGKRTITEWAEPLITKGRYRELGDPCLRGNFDKNQMKHFVNVAALCVQHEPDKRPTMKEVVGLLKGYEPNGIVNNMRMGSVKSEDDLMGMDQAGDEKEGSSYDKSSSSHVQDPYKQYENRRMSKYG